VNKCDFFLTLRSSSCPQIYPSSKAPIEFEPLDLT
jgi:hypothetical protein